MKVQWQLVDVETGKAIKIEEEFELAGHCKHLFDQEGTMPYDEAKMLFGDIDAIKNQIGIMGYKEWAKQ